MAMRLSLPRLRRLADDESGTSVIEFALMLPVLSLLVAGVIDLSEGLADRFALQQAVNRGLEIVQSKPLSTGADRKTISYTFAKTEAERAAPGSVVTIETWLECNGAVQGDFYGTCPDHQDTARYLRLRARKNYTGSMFLGTVPMSATGAMRVQ
ncbi:MAG: hypothetical protein E6G94_05880 [Alphaproteobacteria bacterium]|nr:MAG: hypothetical protein E6G94_05880 [Alphaproteobacteria bacterium]